MSVKTEQNVAESLGILNTGVQVTPNYDWNLEKNGFEQQIVDLKAEREHAVSDLIQLNIKYVALTAEKQKLFDEYSIKEASYLKQIQELQKLKSHIEDRNNEIIQNNTKTISDLKTENKRLQAQLKQFRSGILQRQSNDSHNKTSNEHSDDQSYEVDAIIAHKNCKSGRLYLVRWKGYADDEDSWEKESNLDCPKILNKYKRSIKLN